MPRIALASLILVAIAAPCSVAQRYLPGPRVELPETAGVSVRRPLYFDLDPGAKETAPLLERSKGGTEKKGAYRHWFLTLRHHVGYLDIEHVQTEWEKIIRPMRAGWSISVFTGFRFDGCPGILIQALPPKADPAGRAAKADFTGLVLRPQGRLFEARLEALDWVIVPAGRNFVLDFLSRGVFREALGPRRIPKTGDLAFRFPRGWHVRLGAAPALFVATHPLGERNGAITVSVAPDGASLAAAVEQAGGTGATEAISVAKGATALRTARTSSRIVAAVKHGDAGLVVDATLPDTVDGVTPEDLVVRIVRSVETIDRDALRARATELARSLKKTAGKRKSDSDAAIRTIADLTDLLDLPPAKGVAKHALNATPRVAEAMARALGARGDEASRRLLAAPVRTMTKQKRVASLAAVLRALGKTGSGANVAALERALGHHEAAVVFAAVEALGQANDKPKKTFSAQLEFWTRFEAWIADRPQMKGASAYEEITARLRANLASMSGGTSFASPDEARTWMGANRRKIGW